MSIPAILNGRRSITSDAALRLAEEKSGKEIRKLPKLKPDAA